MDKTFNTQFNSQAVEARRAQVRQAQEADARQGADVTGQTAQVYTSLTPADR